MLQSKKPAPSSRGIGPGTLRSRSSSAALHKTLMGTLAPSSRGVTKVHENSDGYTAWCMVSQPLDSVASSFQFSALFGSPWVTFQRAVFPSFPLFGFGAGAGTGRFFLKLLSVDALSNLGFSARALPFGLLRW